MLRASHSLTARGMAKCIRALRIRSRLWIPSAHSNPFFSIAYPQELGEMISGWLNAYKEAGWLRSAQSGRAAFRCPQSRGCDDRRCHDQRHSRLRTQHRVRSARHHAFDTTPTLTRRAAPSRKSMRNRLFPAKSAEYWVPTHWITPTTTGASLRRPS